MVAATAIALEVGSAPECEHTTRQAFRAAVDQVALNAKATLPESSGRVDGSMRDCSYLVYAVLPAREGRRPHFAAGTSRESQKFAARREVRAAGNLGKEKGHAGLPQKGHTDLPAIAPGTTSLLCQSSMDPLRCGMMVRKPIPPRRPLCPFPRSAASAS